MKTRWGVLVFIIFFVSYATSPYLVFLSRGMGLVTTGVLFALLFIGMYFMWGGREEFGPKHKKSATIGCCLIPISLLTLVGGTFATAALILVALAYVLLVYQLENAIGKILLLAGFFIFILMVVVTSVIVVVGLQGTTYAPWAFTLLTVLTLAATISDILAYIIAFVRVSAMTPVAREEETPEWEPEPL